MRYDIIVHLFTPINSPPDAWKKVQGERDTYSLEIGFRKRIDAAKKLARGALENPFQISHAYILRSYVYRGNKIIYSYYRRIEEVWNNGLKLEGENDE